MLFEPSMNNSEKAKSKLWRTQDRVTDHRIGKSWGNIAGVMDGNLDKILQTLSPKTN